MRDFDLSLASLRTLAASAAAACLLAGSGPALAAESGSALSDEPIPMKTDEEMPERVPPLIELGGDFLGTGNIPSGFELPTGAVWIPQLWVYGAVRSGFNYVDRDSGADDVAELVVRAELNFNLKLSATERFFLQIQPLNDRNEFTSYQFEDDRDNLTDGTNLDVTALFFEGDLGEMFPLLDPEDRNALDIGFAVGRQLVSFQEGMLINDTLDSVALVRDTVIFPGLIDTRFTALYAWNDLSRNDNEDDDSAHLVGLFIESDTPTSTVAIDGAYVFSNERNGGDGVFFGASAVQRIQDVNTAVRVNQSIALDDESAAVSTGTLLFGEFSFAPVGTHDVAYLNAFWGIDEFASAARDANAGGPLGRVGLLFAAPGLGRAPAPLGNRVDDAFGGSVGYQMFFNDDATQVVGEIGGIKSTAPETAVPDGVGVGLRFQHKFLDRFLVQVDGFYTRREVVTDTVGGRVEFTVQF